MMLFSKHKVTADDVLAVLTVRSFDSRGILGEYQNKIICINDNGGQLHGAQRNIQGILPDMLRELDKDEHDDFPTQFVRFATGFPYVPHPDCDRDFKIVVEFHNTELSDDAWPMAHTCENTAKLPASAYLGNGEIFKQSMLRSIKETEVNPFSMA
jgi:HECT-domain (ubiquitin-transferase)